MEIYQEINDAASSLAMRNFCIQSYIATQGLGNLILIGGIDLCYCHEVEICFSEVTYCNLPSDFDFCNFRFANKTEVQNINNIIAVDTEETVFCIEAKTSASLKPIPFLLWEPM